MTISDALLIKLIDKLKIASDANTHRIEDCKDEPLALQFYCGWRHGFNAAIVAILGQDVAEAAIPLPKMTVTQP